MGDIPDSDSIFHSIYDLDHRYQVPGAQYLRSGRTYEYDGYEPRWRGFPTRERPLPQTATAPLHSAARLNCRPLSALREWLLTGRWRG
jgi:hypothetical protein